MSWFSKRAEKTRDCRARRAANGIASSLDSLRRSVAVAVLLSLLPSANASAEERPNVLLIVSEDNGPQLACYGDPYARTPNLDRLAREGVRFEYAFVTQAGCSQSRSSILTGLYPHQNGQLGLATWGFRMYDDTTPNIVRSLKESGYRTGILGKLHVNPESAFPFDFAAMPSSNFARRNLAHYARQAAEFFTSSEHPFFLSVNFPEAHRPWVKQVDDLPAEPLGQDDVKSPAYFGVDSPAIRGRMADYYNCIARLDSLVGDLLAALERSGKAHNTIVVYLGDHGADALRGKRTSYEGGVRIPLIVRWPNGALAAQARKELVSTIDLAPTLLAAAGARPIDGLTGLSLLPLLRGENPAWRKFVYSEFHTHAGKDNFFPQRAVRSDRYKLIENLLSGEVNPVYAFTTKSFVDGADIPGAIARAPEQVRLAYARMEKPPRWELYDLSADPFEFRDLSDDPDHAEVLHELQQQLADWRAASKDPLLDPQNLALLKAEVAGASRGQAANRWQYPNYFFGKPVGAAAGSRAPQP